MTNERLLQILDNILAWGQDHNEEFRECLLDAMELTETEKEELELQHYVREDEE